MIEVKIMLNTLISEHLLIQLMHAIVKGSSFLYRVSHACTQDDMPP
jgi:hypothetical protein